MGRSENKRRGRDLVASCGQTPGPDVKMGSSGLVASAAATTLTGVLGMLSDSLLRVMMSTTATALSFGLLLSVATASTTAPATGMAGSVERCGFGDGVLTSLVDGIGNLAKGDLFS